MNNNFIKCNVCEKILMKQTYFHKCISIDNGDAGTLFSSIISQDLLTYVDRFYSQMAGPDFCFKIESMLNFLRSLQNELDTIKKNL